jgi:hypothetical protein
MAIEARKQSVFSGMGESLAAVLVGNLIYFTVAPLLPGSMRHEIFRPDAGLLVDFLFCVAAFGLIRWVRTSFLRASKT